MAGNTGKVDISTGSETTVLIDGHDVTKWVSRVEVKVGVDQTTTVQVEFIPSAVELGLDGAVIQAYTPTPPSAEELRTVQDTPEHELVDITSFGGPDPEYAKGRPVGDI